MHLDPWILTFSLATVVATVWMGFWSARKSKTAHDFFVAGRSVSVGWNASAISGEYLSAASFMGVAGMVMKNGYDALWYPVCYACGYLFLLLFIAGPLRRFGAYTIPDFAEGRFDSPLFRKIAVIFVLFIGFFYTMPQMKGAGTTLAYIFPGLPYWAGVVLVGSVITLNVALGGMKGITLVQAVQYWVKMFAISVPIFVLMAVYGHYGKQVGANGPNVRGESLKLIPVRDLIAAAELDDWRAIKQAADAAGPAINGTTNQWFNIKREASPGFALLAASGLSEQSVFVESGVTNLLKGPRLVVDTISATNEKAAVHLIESILGSAGIGLVQGRNELIAVPVSARNRLQRIADNGGTVALTAVEVPNRLNFVPEASVRAKGISFPTLIFNRARQSFNRLFHGPPPALPPRFTAGVASYFDLLSLATGQSVWHDSTLRAIGPVSVQTAAAGTNATSVLMPDHIEETLHRSGISLLRVKEGIIAVPAEKLEFYRRIYEREGIYAFDQTISYRHKPLPPSAPPNENWQSPFGPLTTKAAKAAHLSPEQSKPYSLLYTYSLIIALVCGTAGLPHILVRFYTNPDGAAAKRTTMWVMILIGVFYLFPPIFGALGRNLLPELYSAAGAKGTDKIVLELPRILNERFPVWGSVLSGITCAGAFAAFMSTFSGLLVSMTGALAHDVYGRIISPRSTPAQRLKAFKLSAVAVGAVAIVLGMQVEQFDINFMVGQAFAIAAASYFPLLFLSAWWRNITMKGAASGMLGGGVLALTGISLTSFSDLKWLPLEAFWAGHPLLRILCEQPAIWTVPLAVTLMIVISKCTRREVPSDVRMKMLVLHAPEKLGLKQEYIQEHGVMKL